MVKAEDTGVLHRHCYSVTWFRPETPTPRKNMAHEVALLWQPENRGSAALVKHVDSMHAVIASTG
jgi:hypothetical protein